MIEITGDTNASGFKVLSDEYSKPGFKILTLLILFIVFESGNKLALTPWVDPILTNEGNFLYPTPPKFILILSMGPFADFDWVVYLKISVSDEV